MEASPSSAISQEREEAAINKEKRRSFSAWLWYLIIVLLAGWLIWYLSPNQAIRRTVAGYLNTLSGHRQGSVVSYLTPVMQQKFKAKGKGEVSSAELLERMAGMKPSSFSLPAVSPQQVKRIVRRGRFAYAEVIIPPRHPEEPGQRIGLRLVRVGWSWKIYQGFPAEVEEYGRFSLGKEPSEGKEIGPETATDY